VFIRPRSIEQVVDDLRGRREAVRRALALLMIVCASGRLVLVAPGTDVLAFAGRADDDLPRAGVDVGAGLVGVGEQAGRLQHDVDAESPRQCRRVLLLEHLDLAAVDDQRVIGVIDVPDRRRTSSRA
jgi:hypothetical protein